MKPTHTLILDGLWGASSRFERLRRVVEERCGPAEIYRYEASGQVCFEELGTQLARKICERGEAVNVVAHSMGGLVVRAAYWMDPAIRLRRAVFLNSPHQGSWLAYVLPWAGIKQMRPGSEFMRRLEDAKWDIPTLTVWCPWDTMVIPGRNAKWNRATETMRCPVPMHIWPIWSRRVHERVVTFLKAEEVGLTQPLRVEKGF